MPAEAGCLASSQATTSVSVPSVWRWVLGRLSRFGWIGDCPLVAEALLLVSPDAASRPHAGPSSSLPIPERQQTLAFACRVRLNVPGLDGYRARFIPSTTTYVDAQL